MVFILVMVTVHRLKWIIAQTEHADKVFAHTKDQATEPFKYLPKTVQNKEFQI